MIHSDERAAVKSVYSKGEAILFKECRLQLRPDADFDASSISSPFSVLLTLRNRLLTTTWVVTNGLSILGLSYFDDDLGDHQLQR